MSMGLSRVVFRVREFALHSLTFAQQPAPPAHHHRTDEKVLLALAARWLGGPPQVPHFFRGNAVDPADCDKFNKPALLAKLVRVTDQLSFPLVAVLHPFIPALRLDDEVE